MGEIYRLKQIADISIGHGFRGRIEDDPDGDVYVLQVRDTDPTGIIKTDGITKTKLAAKKTPQWLESGDLLFVGKGYSHYAVFISEVPDRTLCSPYFYVVRLKPEYKDRFLPNFVGWQLNQKPAKRYFNATAEGGLLLNIRRSILENAPIKFMPLERQHSLMKLVDGANMEKEKYTQLIKLRQQQLDAIAVEELEIK